jgi:hypothetical protein
MKRAVSLSIVTVALPRAGCARWGSRGLARGIALDRELQLVSGLASIGNDSVWVSSPISTLVHAAGQRGDDSRVELGADRKVAEGRRAGRANARHRVGSRRRPQEV